MKSNSALVGGLEHFLFSMSYMGCHTSQLTSIFFKMVIAPPTSMCLSPLLVVKSLVTCRGQSGPKSLGTLQRIGLLRVQGQGLTALLRCCLKKRLRFRDGQQKHCWFMWVYYYFYTILRYIVIYYVRIIISILGNSRNIMITEEPVKQKLTCSYWMLLELREFPLVVSGWQKPLVLRSSENSDCRTSMPDRAVHISRWCPIPS